MSPTSGCCTEATHHAAIDRLARDMAEDLRPYQITSISLDPGLVLTESVLANIQHFEHETNRETPLFVGRVVAALAADARVFEFHGPLARGCRSRRIVRSDR
jgi:dehydrogenase/reductase SDR family member 1